MNIIKRSIIIGILASIIVLNIKSQDFHFSQFYAAPLYLGPSMAGVYEEPRIIANYRDQWPQLSGRFTTQALSFDVYSSKYRSGLGLFLLHDQIGGNKIVTNQASLNYSYKLEILHNLYIQPGLAFEYYSRNVNYNRLQFADQFLGNDILPGSVENLQQDLEGHYDFASSIMAYGTNYWVGTTVDHLMKLSNNLSSNDTYLPIKLTFYGGYQYKIPQRTLNRVKKSIFLAYMYRNQNSLNQLDLGIYYKQMPLIVGIWYRGIPINSIKANDAIIFLSGYEFKSFTLLYSYDFTVSPLIVSTGGAHEMSLAYRFSKKNVKIKRKGAVPCPVF